MKRWAAAAEAVGGHGIAGGGHIKLLTGTVVWCWRCGAYADRHAKLLAAPCRGVLRGMMRVSWKLLLENLHPLSRVAIGPGPFAEPGARLPAGFAGAVASIHGDAAWAARIHGRSSALKTSTRAAALAAAFGSGPALSPLSAGRAHAGGVGSRGASRAALVAEFCRAAGQI